MASRTKEAPGLGVGLQDEAALRRHLEEGVFMGHLQRTEIAEELQSGRADIFAVGLQTR
tara:strand:- start:5771 stop:5947 length:177 start_codon:yes stop_codon:yes gene_type:complete